LKESKFFIDFLWGFFLVYLSWANLRNGPVRYSSRLVTIAAATIANLGLGQPSLFQER
jgi:hypothetical protein